MERKWIEINVEENYIIFKDEPKKRYPIKKGGKIILDQEKVRFENIELI
jgi:hypothetical protein